MSASTALASEIFRVGKRTCTLTVPRPQRGGVVYMTAEWEPSVPRRLTKRELRAYQAGRNAALTKIAERLGIQITVIDL